MQHYNTIRQISAFLLLTGGALLFCIGTAYAQTNGRTSKKILFICSYSSDTKYIGANITNFSNEFKRKGGKGNIIVESINAASFSQALSWEKKTEHILNKHWDADLVVLLGGETWNCYLTLAKKMKYHTPVMAAMSYAYGINLPTKEDSLLQKHLRSFNIVDEMKKLPNVKCAIAYKYDIKKDVDQFQFKIQPHLDIISQHTDRFNHDDDVN